MLEKEARDAVPMKELMLHEPHEEVSPAAATAESVAVEESHLETSNAPTTQSADLQEVLRLEAFGWPRLVFPPLKRSGHVILDSCTAEGQPVVSLPAPSYSIPNEIRKTMTVHTDTLCISPLTQAKSCVSLSLSRKASKHFMMLAKPAGVICSRMSPRMLHRNGINLLYAPNAKGVQHQSKDPTLESEAKRKRCLEQAMRHSQRT